MFRKFMSFSGAGHRTSKMIFKSTYIYQNNSKLQSKKNGTSLSFLDLSQEVIPLGLEPKTHTLKVPGFGISIAQLIDLQAFAGLDFQWKSLFCSSVLEVL